MIKTFVFTDIHGCYNEMMHLYKKLPIKPKQDRMVFLGDYIDRGKDSKKVISQLIKWNKKYPHWIFLYGNHEDLMLDALGDGHVYHSFDLWYNQGGKETARSYYPDDLSPYERAIASPKDFIPKEHMKWLNERPRYFEDENYIYVHAGITPGKTPAETDPQELIWIRYEFINSDYNWGKKVIFGHTAQDSPDPRKNLTPWVMKNKIGIDTACCYGAYNKLTCVELPKEKFYSQDHIDS